MTARLVILRFLIVVMFLPFAVWTLARRIFIEVRSIPFYVWCDWSDDFDDAKHVWRFGEPRKSDW